MKTVSVSKPSPMLDELLAMARGANVILQLADGTQFLLACLTEGQAFYMGDDDDFDREIEATRSNEQLRAFLDERGQKAQNGQGTPLAEVRKQLAAQR